MQKPHQSMHRPAPNDADIGGVLLPPQSAAFCDARLSESPPVASQLAWDLLECLRTSLTPQERDSAAINLATREFLYVIKLLMAAAVRDNAAIPADVGHHLIRWARTYDGHPDHPALCGLVA